MHQTAEQAIHHAQAGSHALAEDQIQAEEPAQVRYVVETRLWIAACGLEAARTTQ